MTVSSIWTGKSGAEYVFETYHLGTTFKDLSGVYIVCRETIWNKFEALYVGETQSFYRRLNLGSESHSGLKRATTEGATHVAVRFEFGEMARLSVETDLRHGLNPLCNEQAVPRNALAGLTFPLGSIRR